MLPSVVADIASPRCRLLLVRVLVAIPSPRAKRVAPIAFPRLFPFLTEVLAVGRWKVLTSENSHHTSVATKTDHLLRYFNRGSVLEPLREKPSSFSALATKHSVRRPRECISRTTWGSPVTLEAISRPWLKLH